MKKKIKGTSNINAENSSVQETFSLPDQYTHVAGLKKKEKPKGGSKRKKSWTEKTQNKKKKQREQEEYTQTYATRRCKSCSTVPEPQAYESISSFT